MSEIFSSKLIGKINNGKISYKYLVFFEFIGIKLFGKYNNGYESEILKSNVFSNFILVKLNIESISGKKFINPWKIKGFKNKFVELILQ